MFTKSTFTFFLSILISFFPVISFCQAWSQISSVGGGSTDGAVALVIDGKPFIFGGVSTKRVYQYDIDNDNWILKSSIPVNGSLAWAFGFVLNNKAYIVGGDTTGNFDVTDRVQMYDPATDSWTEKGRFPDGGLDGGFSFSQNGKGYLGAGFNGTLVKNDFWEYDPGLDTWTKLNNIPMGRVIFPAFFKIGNKGYVGTGSKSSAETKEFWEINLNTKNWTLKSAFPGSRRQAAVGFAVDGKGYIGGGQSDYLSSHQDFYEYNPSTNAWTSIDSFPISNTAWSSAFVIGNEAYVGLGVSIPSFSFTNRFHTISLGSALSLAQNDQENFEFWPNPCSDWIRIEASTTQETQEIQLLNLNGQVLKTYQIEKGQKSIDIDLSSIPKSIYIVKANGFSQKLVKN